MQHTNTSSMTYERRLDYNDSTSLFYPIDFIEIWARDGSRRGAKGIRTVVGYAAQVAKFGEPVALGICRFRDGSGIM